MVADVGPRRRSRRGTRRRLGAAQNKTNTSAAQAGFALASLDQPTTRRRRGLWLRPRQPAQSALAQSALAAPTKASSGSPWPRNTVAAQAALSRPVEHPKSSAVHVALHAVGDQRDPADHATGLGAVAEPAAERRQFGQRLRRLTPGDSAGRDPGAGGALAQERDGGPTPKIRPISSRRSKPASSTSARPTRWASSMPVRPTPSI